MEISEEALLLRAALVYAARGWKVLPVHMPLAVGCTCGDRACTKRGKHPRTAHGLYEATTDARIITSWWRDAPMTNVGIVTGHRSGLVVLDVDPGHGGLDSLAILEKAFCKLPPTPTVETGGGGFHFYFAAPPPCEGALPNRIELAGLPGLDFRGDGGYIVAPPSLHKKGEAYQWMSGPPLAPLPYWLWSLMTMNLPRPQSVQHIQRPRVAHGRQWLPPEQYWLAKALERARPGTRNATGYWLACRLKEKGVSEAAATIVMQRYAARVGAIGDHRYEAEEALMSLASAYHA